MSRPDEDEPVGESEHCKTDCERKQHSPVSGCFVPGEGDRADGNCEETDPSGHGKSDCREQMGHQLTVLRGTL